jgi:asparagine synthase (glutamine-hydrolysing)
MKSIAILRNLGAVWTLKRSIYLLRKKSGLLKRRFPTPQWSDVTLANLLNPRIPSDADAYAHYRKAHTPSFFFPPGGLADAAILKQVMTDQGVRETIRIADDFCAGQFLLYSHHRKDLGQPVNWLLNPFTGTSHDAALHWCDHPTFSESLGDVKDVWEASRFACAFWLARAYAITRDEKYSAAFWQLVESWIDQNPPNRGPNWKCGQETALRCMAWSFALYALANSPATTPARIATMTKAIALQADRIAGNIAYAVSQKNNHGLSEAAGLITIGLLFPEIRGSAGWLDTGTRIFEREVLRQIYPDGSYVQHSMNYHRVMLHDCLWVIRLCKLNGRPISANVVERVKSAGRFLLAMLDPTSGRVPNYGSNDGALVLPLTSCDYTDYRPTAAAAMYLADGNRALPDGPWDELTCWLFGSQALKAPFTQTPQSSQRFDSGGYYTIRDGDDWCMIRCHTYRDRPAHVDPLHLDLWHRGINIFSDSGTYKYYDPADPASEAFFKDIRAHNTIEIDNRSPLDLISRFMWTPWPKARCIDHSTDAFEGVHDAYAREPWHVTHRRHVKRDFNGWTITDNLLGRDAHHATLRWHLVDAPYTLDSASRTLRLEAPCGLVTIKLESTVNFDITVRRGETDAQTMNGWSSDYYGQRNPRPTLEVSGHCQLPVTLTTIIRLA